MRMRNALRVALTAIVFVMGSEAHTAQTLGATAPELQTMSARLAPVDIRVDVSALPDNERQALVRIIQAAQILDALFMRQVSASTPSRLLALLNDHSALGQARLQYFLINKGPWSELD